MEKECVKRLVTLTLVRSRAQNKEYLIPVAASQRHIHISAGDLETLFGAGYKLNKMRNLSQPDQFACEERITIVGPKGRIDNVRVLGPKRPDTQVEISITDSFKLGIKPVVRMSGELENTPGCKLIGPAGELTLKNGVIVAARHLHISDEESVIYGLKNGDVISVKKSGVREMTFSNVLVRAGKAHSLEMHIDIDEANAACIQNGDLLVLLK
jgi:putative phosphotransacetylase